MTLKNILYVGLDPYYYSLTCSETVTHFPVIQTVPRALQDPFVYGSLQAFNSYTHVILTSKTTISILHNYLLQLGFSLTDWANKDLVVVGHITAQSLKKIGLTANVIARQETAEGIVKELKLINLEKAHVFWPHAAGARTILSEYFTQHQIKHQACILYDTLAMTYSFLPDLNQFQEIVFTSPSTIKAFIQIFGFLPTDIKLTCIGPITEAYLKDYLVSSSLLA